MLSIIDFDMTFVAENCLAVTRPLHIERNK